MAQDASRMAGESQRCRRGECFTPSGLHVPLNDRAHSGLHSLGLYVNGHDLRHAASLGSDPRAARKQWMWMVALLLVEPPAFGT